MKVLLASAIFLSSFAFADNHEGGEGLRVGALYHYNFNIDDRKHRGADAKSEMTHNINLGVTFKGQFNDDVSYSAMLVPSNASAVAFSATCDDGLYSNIVWAHATLKMHEMFSLRVGCMHMNAGGFYGRNRGILNTMQDNPAQGMANPIRRWDKALEFRLTNENVGLFTLQLANDVPHSESQVPRTNRVVEGLKGTDTGIALLAQWEAKFMDDMLHPLLQFGMYDNMKSMYFSLGMSLDYMGVLFRGDFQMNMHDSTTTLTKKDTTTGFNGWLGYNVMDIATPYVAMSMVNTTRDPESKGNTFTAPATGYVRDHVGQLNNNGQVISFGLKMQYGDNFTPYLAVDMVSAKNTTAETKQDHMTIKFGFTGTI